MTILNYDSIRRSKARNERCTHRYACLKIINVAKKWIDKKKIIIINIFPRALIIRQ